MKNITIIYNNQWFECTPEELDTLTHKKLELAYKELYKNELNQKICNITLPYYNHFDKKNIIQDRLEFYSKEQVQKKLILAVQKAKPSRFGIPKKQVEGFVYLATSKDDIKIGCSRDPKKRVKSISNFYKKDYRIANKISSEIFEKSNSVFICNTI